LKVPIGTDLDVALNAEKSTSKIPARGLLLALIIRIVGEFVIVDDDADSLLEDGVLRLIKKVELKVGSQTLKLWWGPMLYQVNALLGQFAGALTQPGFTEATQPFELALRLPLALDSLAGLIYALPVGKNGFPPLTLVITYGGVYDVFVTGGSETITIQNCVVEVTGEYESEVPNLPYALCREVETVTPLITASPASGLEIVLPATLDGLRRVYLLASDDDLRDNAIVTDVALRPDVGILQGESTFLSLRDATTGRFKTTPADGLAVLDFDPDGRMQGMPRLRGLSRPLLVVQNGSPSPGSLRTVPQEIEVPRRR
jgi:hypothetical protein